MQNDLAKALGVNEMTIVNWERYPSIPLRNRDGLQRLCYRLALDYKSMLDQFPWSEALA